MKNALTDHERFNRLHPNGVDDFPGAVAGAGGRKKTKEEISAGEEGLSNKTDNTIRPIRTDADYKRALVSLRDLFDAKPGTPEEDRLEVLSVLITDYENRHHPIRKPTPEELEAFRAEQQHDDFSWLPLPTKKARERGRKHLLLTMKQEYAQDAAFLKLMREEFVQRAADDVHLAFQHANRIAYTAEDRVAVAKLILLRLRHVTSMEKP